MEEYLVGPKSRAVFDDSWGNFQVRIFRDTQHLEELKDYVFSTLPGSMFPILMNTS